MDYEIIATGRCTAGEKPLPYHPGDWRFVRVRLPGGEVREFKHQGEARTPDEVAQWHLQHEAEDKQARAELPDTIDTFGMWVKMDMSNDTWEELKQAYRDHMDELGYDVDAQMVAHRRQPATG